MVVTRGFVKRAVRAPPVGADCNAGEAPCGLAIGGVFQSPRNASVVSGGSFDQL